MLFYLMFIVINSHPNCGMSTNLANSAMTKVDETITSKRKMQSLECLLGRNLTIVVKNQIGA